MRKIRIISGIVASLAALLIATPALAGPVVLIGAVLGAAVGAGGVAAGLITATMLTAAAIGAVVGAGAAFLLGDGMMGMFDVPEMDSIPNALGASANENTGILIDKQGTLEEIPVVYGTRKISGIRVFVDTTGDNNRYLYIALILCEGEIEAIDEIFIDGVLSTDPMFGDRITIERYLGTDNQTSSTLLQESPNWTSDHKLSGIAYLACRFEWKKVETKDDAEKNPFAGIPRIQAIVRGRKIADAQSAGSVNYANETQRYSENPADHLLDYLRNARFGRGLANARIDFASFSQASQKFNQTVTYHLAGSTGPMLTSNCVLNTGKTLMNNVKDLLKNMKNYQEIKRKSEENY